MFRIREEHLEAFRKEKRDDYEDAVVTYLQAVCEEELAAMSSAQINALVHEAVERALEYGLSEEEDATDYVEISFRLGKFPFEKEPEYRWAESILRDYKFFGSEKINLIQERLSPKPNGMIGTQMDG